MRNVSDVSILTISLMVLLSTYAGFVSKTTMKIILTLFQREVVTKLTSIIHHSIHGIGLHLIQEQEYQFLKILNSASGDIYQQEFYMVVIIIQWM